MNVCRCATTQSAGAPAGYCCPAKELAALRAAVDQTIRALDAEVAAPLVIDDGGATRELVRSATLHLRRARAA